MKRQAAVNKIIAIVRKSGRSKTEKAECRTLVDDVIQRYVAYRVRSMVKQINSLLTDLNETEQTLEAFREERS